MMIVIDENAQIRPGNIIYYPAENVRYKVVEPNAETGLRVPSVALEPLPPFGSSTKKFSISIGSMIALGYVIEGEPAE